MLRRLGVLLVALLSASSAQAFDVASCRWFSPLDFDPSLLEPSPPQEFLVAPGQIGAPILCEVQYSSSGVPFVIPVERWPSTSTELHARHWRDAIELSIEDDELGPVRVAFCVRQQNGVNLCSVDLLAGGGLYYGRERDDRWSLLGVQLHSDLRAFLFDGDEFLDLFMGASAEDRSAVIVADDANQTWRLTAVDEFAFAFTTAQEFETFHNAISQRQAGFRLCYYVRVDEIEHRQCGSRSGANVQEMLGLLGRFEDFVADHRRPEPE